MSKSCLAIDLLVNMYVIGLSMGKYFLMVKNIEPLPITKFLIGYFIILMTYKKKKRKDQIKNLFLPFLYPLPKKGTSVHSVSVRA